MFSNFYKEEKYSYKADFEIPYNVGNAASGFFKFGGQYNKQSNSTDQEAPYLGFNGSATDPNGTGIQANLMRTIYDKYGISVNGAGDITGVAFLGANSDLFASFLDNSYGSIHYASDPALLVNMINYISSKPEFDATNSSYSTGNQGGWYDGPYQQLSQRLSF